VRAWQVVTASLNRAWLEPAALHKHHVSHIVPALARSVAAKKVALALLMVSVIQSPIVVLVTVCSASCEGFPRRASGGWRPRTHRLAPVPLASTQTREGVQGKTAAEPALAGVAFTHDNALAGIALLAVGTP
jgi:hypothetical protein